MKWLDAELSYDPPVKLNSYAKVYGNMRKQQDENYVMVVSIQPLEHLNDLCVHLMEVTLVCLQAENIASQPTPNNSSTIDNNPAMNSDSAVSAESSNANHYRDLNKDQIIIMDIISRGDPEYGAERSQIKSHAPSYLISKVDEILEFLSSEGHIYTTRTDDHFKQI